jgi:hypothetical protein
MKEGRLRRTESRKVGMIKADNMGQQNKQSGE